MPRYAEPHVRITVSLPKRDADKLEQLFMDPLRMSIRYAARNELIKQLVRDWIAEREAQTPSASESTEPKSKESSDEY